MSKSTAERLCLHAVRSSKSSRKAVICQQQLRCISGSHAQRATALPITATGPPPQAPEPSQYGTRVDQMRKKAAAIQQAKEIRASQQPGAKSSPLRRRFWKDVLVTETDAGYQIMLDTRPVRTPTKEILTIPKSQPNLAHAIAIEWDLLTSAQQALKTHKIPMTSIMSRAQDIAEAEAQGDGRIREEILRTMMRYLATDTLLCWSPSVGESTFGIDVARSPPKDGPSLRKLQQDAAGEIVSYLNATVWPGVEIKPVLEDGSIMPVMQSEVTTSIISGWISGLSAHDLAGLERAVLATKSLLVATRLLVEWSQEFRDLQKSTEKRFGIEEAAHASTIEVRWQTAMWGEVEDTHDVENEDIRRQLGSTILVISGAK